MNQSTRNGIIIGLVIVVVAIVAIELVSRGGSGAGMFGIGNGEVPAEPTYEGRLLKEVYESDVPRDVEVRDKDAKSVVPASPDSALDTKARRFDMRVTQDGFEPNEIVVNQWDRVEIDFTAVDGKYDFSIPYLGSYFFPIEQGEKKLFIFTVSASGTFTFECRDYCPFGRTIQGSLVVLPREL